MAALIALAAIAVFAAGIFAGVIGVATLAIRREERNLTLTSGSTDTVTRAGRWLNAVYVRSPHRSPPMPGPANVRHAGARYPVGGPAAPAVPAGNQT
jgi:hypothetical protein